MGATVGELGISSVVCVMRSEVLVLRLSWLGLRFMGAIMGLMKEGEEGSDNNDKVVVGGWMDRPFMFLSRLGPGEVMGRSRFGSETVSLAMLDRPPKGVGAKLGRCARLIGESGDEDGDGSERSDESAIDNVVVGEESADSVVCVDVLSLCRWIESDCKAPGLIPGCGFPASFEPSMTILGSTIVTGFDWSKSVIPLSTS
jgi:hypothetical protein